MALQFTFFTPTKRITLFPFLLLISFSLHRLSLYMALFVLKDYYFFLRCSAVLFATSILAFVIFS